MRWFQALLFRLRAITRRPTLEEELEAEMADHLASETEELIRRGMSPQQARETARRTMGRTDRIEEECRDARGVTWWEHLRQDIGFAFRILRKKPAFSAMAIATIALGIGSTTAVFSIVDTVLLRPLPYPEPGRLVLVEGIGMPGPFEAMRATSRLADYAGWQGVEAFNLLTPGSPQPERIRGSRVSANLFDVLRVKPLVGRTFRPEESRPGLTRVVVLSYAFWQTRCGAREDIVGQQIILDDQPHEVAGVMPPDFRFPSPEVLLWTPMVLDPRAIGAYWGSGGTQMLARLRAGVDASGVLAELQAKVPGIRAMFPWRMPDAWGTEVKVSDLRDALVSDARARTWMLLGVVFVLLLISVVNVANLMIGHAAGRAREMALRRSLGATAGRLARQMLTESLVLTLAGGVLGVALAFGELEVLKHWLPSDTPRLADVSIDLRVLGLTAAATLACALLIGLWPAWKAQSQTALAGNEGGRGATPGVRGVRTDTLLVMTEAVFATVLLVASGLLVRSLWTLMQIDPGFRVDSIVTAEISPGPGAVDSAAKRELLWTQVRDRLRRYPGVREIAGMNLLPMTPQVSAVATAIEDLPIPPGQPLHVLWRTAVTPEHLNVLGLRLLQGRAFTSADRSGAEPVVLISRATAERFWPNRSPLGRRIKPVSGREWVTIVGVVDNVKNFGITGLPSWVSGEIYLPMAQAPQGADPLSLIAQVQGDPTQFEQALGGLVHEVCASCAVSRVARMEQVVARALETPRSTASLVGCFAVLALLLAAAGIYGVVSHGVLRRTRELGVRVALGASRVQLVRAVVGTNLRSIAAGVGIGLAIAWFLAGLMEKLVYGIPVHDPVSFAAPVALLFAVTAVASFGPVLRALRINPAQTLRQD
jgi:predicted permease